jgi:hypothetical protein
MICLAALVITRTQAPKAVQDSQAVPAAQTAQKLEATAFLLKDEAGNLVAELSTQPKDGTCLRLNAPNGMASVRLCVGQYGTSSLNLSRSGGSVSEESSGVALLAANPPDPPLFWNGSSFEAQRSYANVEVWGEGERGSDFVSISALGNGPHIQLKRAYEGGAGPSISLSSSDKNSEASLIGRHGKKVWTIP